MQLRSAEILRELMEIQGLSARQLAAEIGWTSHSYANRLLSGARVGVCDEAARRIAKRLHVGVSVLFVPSPSHGKGQIGRQR